MVRTCSRLGELEKRPSPVADARQPLCGAECDGHMELRARAEAEFAERLAQVVFDGAYGDVELRSDFGVGEPVACELRDPRLLRGELVQVRLPPAVCSDSCCGELVLCSLCERSGTQ